jgi:hypothetical protein
LLILKKSATDLALKQEAVSDSKFCLKNIDSPFITNIVHHPNI